MKRSDASKRRSSSHGSVVGKFRKNEFELIAGKNKEFIVQIYVMDMDATFEYMIKP